MRLHAHPFVSNQRRAHCALISCTEMVRHFQIHNLKALCKAKIGVWDKMSQILTSVQFCPCGADKPDKDILNCRRNVLRQPNEASKHRGTSVWICSLWVSVSEFERLEKICPMQANFTELLKSRKVFFFFFFFSLSCAHKLKNKSIIFWDSE